MDKTCGTGVVWQYPPDVRASLAPLTPEQRRADMTDLRERLSATIARIDDRIAAEAERRKEMEAALAWCRANGNPHTPKEPPHAG